MPLKSITPNRICEICSKPFHARPETIRRGWGRCCSRSCANRARTQNMERVSARFWAKIDKRGPDDCWLYTGGIGSTGRGVFGIGQKCIDAHRVSWLLTCGEIPDGLCVLHKCDNGRCVNPLHLFLGTLADNIHDMDRKGRRHTLKGEADPKSKLTEAQVRQIRTLYRPYEFSQFKLADIFGVSRTTIQSVLNGSNWKHVK